MLRCALLFLSGQSWLRRWMETSPASRKFTSRFVAGRTLDDAIRVARQLSGDRVLVNLDHLGENVKSLDEAARSRDLCLAGLDRIAAEALPATVSIKLTQFGLALSRESCIENVTALVQRAQATGAGVEIDMESSEYTDQTLSIVDKLHHKFPGFVRAVVQAYLFRSEQDIQHLSERRIPVRLCKGAYREPAEVAFQDKAGVDRNYLKLMKLLLDQGVEPAIASHDEAMINECLRYVDARRIAPDLFEFQMLYGIRRDLQRKLTANGFRVRAYVPYGDAWYPYFMRRLAERPANLLFLARNFLRG